MSTTGSSLSAGAISRRKLLQAGAVGGAVAGAAWLTPSVLHRDVASAGSCDRLVDWDTFTTGSTFTSTVIAGTTVSLSTALFKFGGGGNSTALGTNRTIVAAPQGGINQKALRIEQTPVQDAGQEITFTFAPGPVTNVSFTITDIDLLNGNWSDRVAILTTPFVGSAAGANIIGVGANSTSTTNNGVGAYRANVSNNIPNTSGAGNITITIAGPVTSVVLRFFCGSVAGGGNQLINITDINFTKC